jgi:hypothetical protein
MGDDHDDHDGEHRDDHEGDHEGGPRGPRPEGDGAQAQGNAGGDAQAQAAGPGAPEERRRGDGRPGGRRRGGGPRREVQNVHRFEADALNRDRDVIGKIYGRRVEGFGTVITKTEWFDQTGQPAPKEQKPE